MSLVKGTFRQSWKTDLLWLVSGSGATSSFETCDWSSFAALRLSNTETLSGWWNWSILHSKACPNIEGSALMRSSIIYISAGDNASSTTCFSFTFDGASNFYLIFRWGKVLSYFSTREAIGGFTCITHGNPLWGLCFLVFCHIGWVWVDIVFLLALFCLDTLFYCSFLGLWLWRTS